MATRLPALAANMLREPPKPWSVDQFEQYRPHLTTFIKDKVVPLLDDPSDSTSRALIHGHVKVGKREMAEYTASRDHSNSPRRVHCFVTAFHRAADETQRDELRRHGLKVFSLSTRSDTSEVLAWIQGQIQQGRTVVIHYDEADYASGEHQRLSAIWGRTRENAHVKSIFYSATPEELLYSACITQTDEDDDFVMGVYDTGVVVHYDPPAGYCGAKRFLQENLVVNATRFFYVRRDGSVLLSTQAREILADAQAQLETQLDEMSAARIAMRTAERNGDIAERDRQKAIYERPVRNIITLRLPYSFPSQRRKNIADKAIYTFLERVDEFPELTSVEIRVDKSDIPEGASHPAPRVMKDTIQWSEPTYWNQLTKERIILVVMDQTSSRSTEWCFHNRLFATHEYRPGVTYCVCAQAQLRVAHYEAKYGVFQPIRVYGHLKTFKFAAGQCTVADYMQTEWSAKKVRNSPLVRIVNPRGDPHPDYALMTEDAADEILEVLGCSATVKISDRVKGRARRVPKVCAHWEPSSPTTFPATLERLRAYLQTQIPADASDAVRARMRENIAHAFRNPFDDPELLGADGRWMCRIRATRETREDAVVSRSRWGFDQKTVGPRLSLTYRDGELGVTVRYTTGDEVVLDTLETFQSMYKE